MKFKTVTLITCLLMLVVSCDKGGKVRKYKEKGTPAPTGAHAHSPMTKTETPAPGTGNAPGADAAAVHAHFQWETPGGWDEEKKTSGFRLASFTVKSPGSTGQALCTVIPLQGEAGGLKANVSRWLGQIASDAGPADVRLDQLLEKQEKFITRGGSPRCSSI